MNTIADPSREQFLELVRLLGECSEPYSVAAALLVENLSIVDDLRQEMSAFVDDMVTLARLDQYSLPEADVTDVRRDLHEMGQLRKRLELGLLFSRETRERCSRFAVPVLALITLFRVRNWMEYGARWLESVDRLRIQVEAILGDRFQGVNPNESTLQFEQAASAEC